MKKITAFAVFTLCLFALSQPVCSQQQTQQLTNDDVALIRAATRTHRLPENIENMPFTRDGSLLAVYGDTRRYFGTETRASENSGNEDPEKGFDFKATMQDFLLDSLYQVATRPNDNVDPNFESTDLFSTERERDIWLINAELLFGDITKNLIRGMEMEILTFFHHLPRHQAVLTAELETIDKLFLYLSTDDRIEALYMAMETIAEINLPSGSTVLVEFYENGYHTVFGKTSLRAGFEIFRWIQGTAEEYPQLIPFAHPILDLLEKKGLIVIGKEYI